MIPIRGPRIEKQRHLIAAAVGMSTIGDRHYNYICEVIDLANDDYLRHMIYGGRNELKLYFRVYY